MAFHTKSFTDVEGGGVSSSLQLIKLIESNITVKQKDILVFMYGKLNLYLKV